MEIPFTAKFTHGFGHGKSLVIRGRPQHQKAWFAVTLFNGLDMLHSKHDNPTKMAPLQVQARLDENLVVLNTHDGRNWGTEERKPGFQVRHDTINELKITCNGNVYEIYFNGALFARYNQRMDQSAATHFNFYGDFKTSEVIYI